jgi:hypothetical protein
MIFQGIDKEYLLDCLEEAQERASKACILHWLGEITIESLLLTSKEMDRIKLELVKVTGCSNNIETPAEHARRMEIFWREGDAS